MRVVSYESLKPGECFSCFGPEVYMKLDLPSGFTDVTDGKLYMVTDPQMDVVPLKTTLIVRLRTA